MEHKLFDSHAHYNHFKFDSINRDDLMKELRSAGISKIVIPPISYESNEQALNMFGDEKFSKKNVDYPDIYFAVGIHPKIVQNLPDDKEMWEKLYHLFDNQRTVAVKTGLDYNRCMSDGHKEHQKLFLERLTTMANILEKLIIFHVRGFQQSDDAVLDLIKILEKNPLKGSALVHCYSYNMDITRCLIDVGVNYIGVGGAVTYEENQALRETVKALPVENILLETDAPYQKPLNYEGSVNTSITLVQVAEQIAKLKGLSLCTVENATYNNACEFYEI